jgi:hypothetical protein
MDVTQALKDAENSLAEFSAALAKHIAHERGWSIEDATRWVERHLAEARKEYRELGVPLGDTDAGFLAWLQPRKQPPTA